MWLPSGDMNEEKLCIAEPDYKQGFEICSNKYMETKVNI